MVERLKRLRRMVPTWSLVATATWGVVLVSHAPEFSLRYWIAMAVAVASQTELGRRIDVLLRAVVTVSRTANRSAWEPPRHDRPDPRW